MRDITERLQEIVDIGAIQCCSIGDNDIIEVIAEIKKLRDKTGLLISDTDTNHIVTELRRYNAWRRGDDSEQPDPKRLGELIEAAANEIERMSNLIKTPVGWQFTIDPYCDHQRTTGFVARKENFVNSAIPKDKITWEPIYLG